MPAFFLPLSVGIFISKMHFSNKFHFGSQRVALGGFMGNEIIIKCSLKGNPRRVSSVGARSGRATSEFNLNLYLLLI